MTARNWRDEYTGRVEWIRTLLRESGADGGIARKRKRDSPYGGASPGAGNAAVYRTDRKAGSGTAGNRESKRGAVPHCDPEEIRRDIPDHRAL